jgi:hypothetical protein
MMAVHFLEKGGRAALAQSRVPTKRAPGYESSSLPQEQSL